MEKIIYAGTIYEVIYRGDRVLHLRSLRDKSLVVHVNVNSDLLEPFIVEEHNAG